MFVVQQQRPFTRPRIAEADAAGEPIALASATRDDASAVEVPIRETKQVREICGGKRADLEHGGIS
jgi:hypothetical protein